MEKREKTKRPDYFELLSMELIYKQLAMRELFLYVGLT
jgi:hypothetical protein